MLLPPRPAASGEVALSPGAPVHVRTQISSRSALSPSANRSVAANLSPLHSSPEISHRSPRPQSPRPGLSEYDPVAFRMGDTHVGDWRQTVSQFPQFDGSLTSLVVGSLSQAGETPEPSYHSPQDNEHHDDDREELEWQPPLHREQTAQNVRPTLTKRSGPQFLGIRQRSPAFQAWLLSRIGTRTSVSLLFVFVLSTACRTILDERVWDRGVNFISVEVACNLVSLISALIVSTAVEGSAAFTKIFSWHPLWRFAGVALFFTTAQGLLLLSRLGGTDELEIVTVGYVYLPIAIVLSYFVFSRRYGYLEWLTCGMMTLAVLTFVLLRQQSIQKEILDGHVKFHLVERISSGMSFVGVLLAVSAVFASVIASILAERIFKDRSRGLKSWSPRFYIMQVHITVTQLALSCCSWVIVHSVIYAGETKARSDDLSEMLSDWNGCPGWFGVWTSTQYCYVAVRVVQGWAAGLLVKEFSTVTKSIVTTLVYIFVVELEDPLMGGRWHFQDRRVPSIMLCAILILSAIIFQTGRINLKVIQQAANLGASGLNAGAVPMGPAALAVAFPSSGSELPLQDSGDGATSQVGGQAPLSKRISWLSTWRQLVRTYALIVLYIVADAVRNLTLAKALNSTRINPNSMSLVIYMLGIGVASLLTLYTDGREALKRAFHVGKIMRCMPAGFMFALTTTLMNMAYSQGMSAALALVLGKFYTPVAALGARWVLNKFYMWLEYAAIAILTLASMTFGYLKAFDTASGEKPSLSTLGPTLLVLGAATAAAFNSLITERILKGETVPFHMQKVRLDAASIIATVGLIPIVGWLSERPQDIPWVVRPLSGDCPWESVCWNQSEGGCENPACQCPCGSGLFAGWTQDATPVIVLALVINTGYGWLCGKLVQHFSTIHRAIADSFSLLVVYFIGDPLLNGSSLSNMCLNLVAFIVPLSTGIFSVAAAEMERVMAATERLTGHIRAVDIATSSESDDSSDSEDEESNESGSDSSVRARCR